MKPCEWKRWGKLNPSWSSGRRTAGLVLIMTLLIGLALALFVFRLGAAERPQLELVDLLFLTPDSVGKVQAAARAGDIQAQSTLGTVYLQGNQYVPRDVTSAVYWFRKVADRDEQEFTAIRPRMKSILEQRRLATDRKKQRKLDLEYLGLVEKRLAFELAFVGLIQVYSGGQGSSYENPALARRYLRQGAAYGFASAQRMLGMAYLFGLLGVPKNASQGLRLLHAAAAQGDHTAEYVLRELYELRAAVPANADTARYWLTRAAN